MKDLKMRELRGDDLFPLIHIIGKLDITDDFVELLSGQEKIEIAGLAEMTPEERKAALEPIIEARGVKIMARLLKKIMLNLTNVKDELNAFLAELSGSTPQAISELGIVDKTELIKAFFKKPELLGFFKSVASFLA